MDKELSESTKKAIKELQCRQCGRTRGLMNGLCDGCYIEKHGSLFPELKNKKEK